MFTLYRAGEGVTGARFSLSNDREWRGVAWAESYHDSYFFSWLTDETPKTFFQKAGRIIGVEPTGFAVKFADHSSRLVQSAPEETDGVLSVRLSVAEEDIMLRWQQDEESSDSTLLEGGIKLSKPETGEDIPLGMLVDLWKHTGTVALAQEAADMAPHIRSFIKEF